MCVTGISGSLVRAECFITNGLPAFEIVGLPDAAVKEARERVRAAAKTSGLTFPAGRITLNLSPANLKKSGTHFDLPILLSILIAYHQVKRAPEDAAFIGELSLDGVVRPVNGVLSMVLAAKEQGIKTVFVPADNAPEATLARGPAIIPVRNVNDIVFHLNGDIGLHAQPDWEPKPDTRIMPDFKDVMGQSLAKRALEVAAAGGHNVLLIGPPGSGKSMLSKRVPSILPDMSWEESLEVTQIYSVMGLLPPNNPLARRRPFRAPHHTVSNAGLVGGGANPRPGEISLAHRGVLFLDELPEFSRDTLDLMRQPLEDTKVTISRASGSVTYPADFMLVCAMNPCKCGWYGDKSNRCTCSPALVRSYRSRISGPLLDRIDIVVNVPAIDFDELKARQQAEPSAQIKRRVDAARSVQTMRYGSSGVLSNSHMGPDELRKYCELDEACTELMRTMFDKFNITARSYDRILKVARTIADLANHESIAYEDLMEAIQFRHADILDE